MLDAFVAKADRKAIIEDAHGGPIANPDIKTVDDVFGAFFSAPPAWVGVLMRVRNRIVGVFGFDTGDSDQRSEAPPERAVVGQDMGVFSVIDRSASEILLGGNDKHFDMRVSLVVEDDSMKLATFAFPKTRIGTVYLTIVNPFHKVVAGQMAKRIAR